MEKNSVNKTNEVTETPSEKGFTVKITFKLVGKILNGFWKVAILVMLFMSTTALINLADMTYFAITGGDTNNPNNPNKPSLTSTDWYKGKVYGQVDDVNKLFNLDFKNYIVYFRQDGCKFCEEAEAEIVKWLEAGNDSVVNFIFVDMANNAQLWSKDDTYKPVANPDNFYVVGTPMFLHKKPDGTFEVGSGPQFLKDIFSSYK